MSLCCLCHLCSSHLSEQTDRKLVPLSRKDNFLIQVIYKVQLEYNLWPNILNKDKSKKLLLPRSVIFFFFQSF